MLNKKEEVYVKETEKDVKNTKNQANNTKKVKSERKESCRFLFDMIGRIFPRG